MSHVSDVFFVKLAKVNTKKEHANYMGREESVHVPLYLVVSPFQSAHNVILENEKFPESQFFPPHA